MFPWIRTTPTTAQRRENDDLRKREKEYQPRGRNRMGIHSRRRVTTTETGFMLVKSQGEVEMEVASVVLW